MLISPAVFTAEEEEKKYERDLHTEGPMKDFGAEPVFFRKGIKPYINYRRCILRMLCVYLKGGIMST